MSPGECHMLEASCLLTPFIHLSFVCLSVCHLSFYFLKCKQFYIINFISYVLVFYVPTSICIMYVVPATYRGQVKVSDPLGT